MISATTTDHHTKAKVTGFFRKKASGTNSYTITIENKKTVSIHNLLVHASIPRSHDPRLRIDAISPALNNSQSCEDFVQVSPGVKAYWFCPAPNTLNNKHCEGLFKDGRFYWQVEELKPGEKVDLIFQWRSTVPAKMLGQDGTIGQVQSTAPAEWQ